MSATVQPTLVPARPAAAAPSGVETIIKPKQGWIGVDWAELVSHRELLAFLVWRDVKVKYKQAIFGSAWAIVVPLVQVLIYSGIGILAGFSTRTNGDAPYTVWMYAGLLPWLFISAAISSGGLSLINNQTLLSKIYMPRLFIPAAMIGSSFVDMLMSGLVFCGTMAFFILKSNFHWWPNWHIVFVPFLTLLLIITAMGTAFLLSALTVMFRDLRFIIPFITQLGIWLTAVAFPQTIFVFKHADGTVTDYRPWLALNPFAGIIQAFRWAITGEPLQVLQLTSSIIFGVVLFIFGAFYFKRVERRFADIA
jgi:lipopolysaccharide transport system permease protein